MSIIGYMGGGNSKEVKELTSRVNILENRTGHVYGIRRSLTTTSPTWERINDSIDLVANATKDGTEVINDFDNIYPWSEIISKNIDIATGETKSYYGDLDFSFDGSNGDVFTHIPKFWYKVWQDEEYDYIQIADYPKSGFTEAKEFDIARYQASVGEDGVLHSVSGAETSTFKNIVTYRNMVKNIGEDYCLMDWRYFLIQLLYLVEYATYNSQSALGNGMASMRHNTNDVALIAEENTNRFIVNTTAGNAFIVGQIISIGTFENLSCDIRTITEINDYSDDDGITGKEIVFDGEPLNITTAKKIWTSAQKTGELDALGMKSGCLINDSKHAVIYRGIENIFANIPSFIDGININNRVAYICYDPAKYASDVFDGDYQKLGYTNLETSCYPKTLGFDENHPLVRFPTESGGSSTTGTTDYYYQSTGKMVARVGGSLNFGTSCGLWYWVLSSSSSFVSWTCGARVLKYQ